MNHQQLSKSDTRAVDDDNWKPRPGNLTNVFLDHSCKYKQPIVIQPAREAHGLEGPAR